MNPTLMPLQMMKKLLLILSLGLPATLSAQQVDFKSGLITVDGKDIARVIRIKDKEHFGLTSTYELDNLAGTKLIIATIATDFVPPRNDNSGFYYRLTFLTSGQVAVFSLNRLGAEKSFARLIGESGIVVNDQLDANKINELIALKSKNPPVQIEYRLVSRSRLMKVIIKEDRVLQGDVVIGQFKDVSNRQDLDTYEFSLPSGLVVAKASFSGGNAMKNYLLFTYKDAKSQLVKVNTDNGTFGQAIIKSDGVDRNQEALKVIARWLVQQDYL